jgi:hypothetical protein
VYNETLDVVTVAQAVIQRRRFMSEGTDIASPDIETPKFSLNQVSLLRVGLQQT